MRVFKFGGASLENVDRIKNVYKIISQQPEEKLMIVISAIGKTTNDLERVVENYYLGKREIASQLLLNISQQHIELAEALLNNSDHPIFEQVRQFFLPVNLILGEKPYREYDFYYDQIVSIGELLSSTILSAYLNQQGTHNNWIDVRTVIRTDKNFRDANLNIPQTQEQINLKIVPFFEQQQ
ncbi:MAG: amino acid kinase family protein, partial [Chitinophagaceae bacterium]